MIKQQSMSLTQKRQPLWWLGAMTRLYCKRIHGSHPMCQQCKALIEFEIQRVSQCTGNTEGTGCQKCTRQCYPDAIRLEINHIVRWAEPKMQWRKPILLARHLVLELIH